MDKRQLIEELKRNPKMFVLENCVRLLKHLILDLRRKNNMLYKYAIEIFYSEEDKGYIAIIPELPGCSAFGETEEKALEEIKMAMELWLETAKKRGKKNSTTAWERTPQDSLQGCLSHHTP